MGLHPTLVLNVVGLSRKLLGPDTPHLSALAQAGACRPISEVTPAVTCTAQSTYLTGVLPSQHGIVANGWYFRDLSEVWFWRQSNRLVQAPKIWEMARARDPDFTCANLFWWHAMYASVDFTVTPRPMYPADGRKIPDVYTEPPELRDELTRELGQFPLFNFWGPLANVVSSQWITRAALRVLERHSPSLTLVYLPHLDYNLQRLGPDTDHPRLRQDLREVDGLSGELIEAARSSGRRVVVVSEYGITPVSGAVAINRALRSSGFLRVRTELGRELLDAGASEAFAVVDHQLAHVYVQRPDQVDAVRRCIEELPGVEAVHAGEGKQALGLNHERSGELVAVSRPDRWFSYPYWLEPERAPDFARTVDIHRKPGYDPVELFLDPKLALPKLSVGYRLLKKRLGFRTLMDVISSEDTDLVRGSHGRPTDDPDDGPLLLSNVPELTGEGALACTDVCSTLLAHLFDG